MLPAFGRLSDRFSSRQPTFVGGPHVAVREFGETPAAIYSEAPTSNDSPASEELRMTVHAITAVRLDQDTRRITHVLWGQVSVSGEQFEVAPHESPVVDALAKGYTVVTVFPLDGQRVAGPGRGWGGPRMDRNGARRFRSTPNACRSAASRSRVDDHRARPGKGLRKRPVWASDDWVGQ
jgi:hypothetical protein